MAKYYKAIDVDVVGNPDGNGRRVIALIVSTLGDLTTGETVRASQVQGLSEIDIIDSGSVLICPAGTFIFFQPEVITKKDDASGADQYDYAPSTFTPGGLTPLDPGAGMGEI